MRIRVYPGQYYDQETGLHYNWHRDYHPGIGRYIEADPIGLEGGINLFVYSKNNPIRLIDPEALKVQICYSPMDPPIRYIAKHASIKTSSCGTWGFYPKKRGRDILFGTPGVVKDDSNKKGLDCKDTAMTKCVNEQCVCKKIRSAKKNPGSYGVLTYNCNSWVRKIISECQR